MSYSVVGKWSRTPDGRIKCLVCESSLKNYQSFQSHYKYKHVPQLPAVRAKLNTLRKLYKRKKRAKLTDAEKQEENRKHREYLNSEGRRKRHNATNVKSRLKAIQKNKNKNTKLICDVPNCPTKYTTYNPDSFYKHRKYWHDFDSLQNNKKYKNSACTRFVRKMSSEANSLDIIEFDSQTEENAAVVVAQAEVPAILKTLSVPHLKYYMYYLIMVNPVLMNGYNGLMDYLRRTKGDINHKKYSYTGKSSTDGPSSYHTNKNFYSPVREFCASKQLSCYHVATYTFDGAEARKFAETCEFFWQVIGKMQKRNKINDFESINVKLEPSLIQAYGNLNETLISQANHLARTGHTMLCLENNCSLVHQKDGFPYYGKRHIQECDIKLMIDATESNDDSHHSNSEVDSSDTDNDFQ